MANKHKFTVTAEPYLLYSEQRAETPGQAAQQAYLWTIEIPDYKDLPYADFAEAARVIDCEAAARDTRCKFAVPSGYVKGLVPREDWFKPSWLRGAGNEERPAG